MAATVGGAFVVFAYPLSSTLLGLMLAFSAGIMLYVGDGGSQHVDQLHGHHGARAARFVDGRSQLLGSVFPLLSRRCS